MYGMKNVAETEEKSKEEDFECVVQLTKMVKPFVYKGDSNIMSGIGTFVP